MAESRARRKAGLGKTLLLLLGVWVVLFHPTTPTANPIKSNSLTWHFTRRDLSNKQTLGDLSQHCDIRLNEANFLPHHSFPFIHSVCCWRWCEERPTTTGKVVLIMIVTAFTNPTCSAGSSHSQFNQSQGPLVLLILITSSDSFASALFVTVGPVVGFSKIDVTVDSGPGWLPRSNFH